MNGRMFTRRTGNEFDFNYKIPRTPKSNNEDAYDSNQHFQRTILDNVYRESNDMYRRRLSPGPLGEPSRFNEVRLPPRPTGESSRFNEVRLLPGPIGEPSSFNEVQNNSYLQTTTNYIVNQLNFLKRPREVPKTPVTQLRYGDTFPHKDPSLPKELLQQFQPLFCKLCTAKLSSNIMAKLHYQSKKHEKKVRTFLVEYSNKTGEPLHEMAQSAGDAKRQKLDDDNPKHFYCDVCDLPLTGRLHAESHYMGKNHQRALAGKSPAGKGCFNQDGKWTRHDNLAVAKLTSDRDNFGLDFAPAAYLAPRPAVEMPRSTPAKTTNLACEVCKVNVTSEQQMTLHINGQKHQKRIQSLERDYVDENPPPGNLENNILSTLGTGSLSDDLSVYRTPTGHYYCNPCNLTMNSEIQFNQHLASKKHWKKANLNKE